MTTTKERKHRKRLRLSSDFITTSREAHKMFLENTKYNTEFKLWKKINTEFNSRFIDNVIKSGTEQELPQGMGKILIMKQQAKTKIIVLDGKKVRVGLSINFGEYRKTGKVTYFTNPHTDGYHCKYVWLQNSARFANSKLWTFRVATDARRKLSAFLQSPNCRYALERYKLKK